MNITKRRVVLALVNQKDENSPIGDGKPCALLGIHNMYLPRYATQSPTDIIDGINRVELINHCDVCRIIVRRSTDNNEETQALKILLMYLFKERVEKLGKKCFVEEKRILQYRLGGRKFLNHHKLLDWICDSVENFERKTATAGNRKSVQRIMAITAACAPLTDSEKGSRKNTMKGI